MWLDAFKCSMPPGKPRQGSSIIHLYHVWEDHILCDYQGVMFVDFMFGPKRQMRISFVKISVRMMVELACQHSGCRRGELPIAQIQEVCSLEGFDLALLTISNRGCTFHVDQRRIHSTSMLWNPHKINMIEGDFLCLNFSRLIPVSFNSFP